MGGNSSKTAKAEPQSQCKPQPGEPKNHGFLHQTGFVGPRDKTVQLKYFEGGILEIYDVVSKKMLDVVLIDDGAEVEKDDRYLKIKYMKQDKQQDVWFYEVS